MGIDPRLKAVVELAITYTTVDFGVTEGLRTLERQKQLVAEKKSQTLDSKHLRGLAIDVIAYVDGQVSWNLKDYYPIAEAFKRAATELNVPITWGAAWTIKDIRKAKDTMRQAVKSYVDYRQLHGKPAFIDAPHFEIAD